MKQKIKAWFNKQVELAQWIHKNKKMRVKFRWIYIGFLTAVFLLFIASVVLFYFYGLRFDPNKPAPYAYTDSVNAVFLAFGIILFIIAVVLGVVIGGIFFPQLFKNSKELYMRTNEYKQQVQKYSEIDLTKFTFRELKWLKKLAWIDQIEFQQTLAKKRKRQ